MDSAAERAASLRAHPNISAAAKMLGIAPSTLSRRDDLPTESRGDRDLVLAPSEVLRLATVYRKRSLNDVAQDLIDLARESSADDAGRVEDAVESFFEGQVVSTGEREEFLDMARRLLPAGLLAKVEASLAAPSKELPDSLTGHPPRPQD